MKVGILGSGDVGRALGKGFVNRQHEVKIASRTPNSDKLKTWVNQVGRNASAGTFAESAAFGDIIVLEAEDMGKSGRKKRVSRNIRRVRCLWGHNRPSNQRIGN